MITKGGSEALLTALVNNCCVFTPNYTVLLPLLHLLAKVGHRDRRIGVKAEDAGAVLLVLKLLKHNVHHARRAAACLWVIRVFSSSVCTAKLIGENQGLDIIYHLIPLICITFTITIKITVMSSPTLCPSFTGANISSVVHKGYISGLLWLYKDWHTKDTQHVAVEVRYALLCCLHKATCSTAGRQALVSDGGLGLLYETTQSCLSNKSLECLVEPSVQLMRKCLPKTPLPLTSDQSVYTFPLPGRPPAAPDVGVNSEDSDFEEDKDTQEADVRDYDDDLETDVNKLRHRPEPDRSKNQLLQYGRLCPELTHDFQVCVGDASLNDRLDDEEDPGQGSPQFVMIDRLLERHGGCIPHHDPELYCAIAAKITSIPGFNILAFPDFWGHLPPPGNEIMAPRKPKIQRQKVFEDIRRFLNTDDIINKVINTASDPQYHPESLNFFSKFECGNLRKAIQVRRHEYDLVMNADANCSQHTQWFYFEVSNMEANVPYRFNVINCEKCNSQFNYGMQPVLYSVKEALEGRPHWVRTGTEVCYFRNYFCPAQGRRRTTFYTLTFTVTFKHNEDVCYMAYHYPYTYSALKMKMDQEREHELMNGHTSEHFSSSLDPCKVFFRQQVLCSTLAGNSCPVVTITACPASRAWKDLHQMRNRPCVVLTGRVHPGESNASWVMKGTLEFLCSDDLVAQSLREAFIFKIIPMLNPDGVINGMNRCDLNSLDLNRQWCKPDPVLSPTIYHTKGFLYYLNSIGRTPLVYCDYHGHSRKKNVFLYGCSVKETLWQSGSAVDTVGLKEDPGYRTIPKTLDRIAPAFSFNSCNYLVEKSRSATARVVVWREIGVLRSYTMESTYNGCNQGIFTGLQVGTRELQDMGLKFCHSLLSVTSDMRAFYTRKLINHVNLDHNILDHKSHNCFEDDEPPCVEEIEYSPDCPSLKGDDLDSDVNSSMAKEEEEEEEYSTCDLTMKAIQASSDAHISVPNGQTVD
uniref:ATP/GTP binding protein-like 1 n=1 Tax=Salarias fasciatus TaxID=181472 RepID=A0A672F6B0_SALFA